jgi:hypothetical protein
MKVLWSFLGRFLVLQIIISPFVEADLTLNQTALTTPILPGSALPFTVQIEEAGFLLPVAIHSGVAGRANGKWLFLAGRTNGLHGFNNDPNNFPPSQQNTYVQVVDPVSRTTSIRSLTDPGSGLSQHQIDLLSVTSPQAYQLEDHLYMTGGYGVDTATGEFSTKDVLTAIHVAGLMHWVENPLSTETAAQHIRQISHPLFQITGGYMDRVGDYPTLLIFGQNFQGFYFDPVSNGIYSKQVRRFDIVDNGTDLSIKPRTVRRDKPNQNYRRRDLNVVPVVRKKHGKEKLSFVALSGVFTTMGGIWTVPVEISARGKPSMSNPSFTHTFKQGMNNYACPTLGLYNKDEECTYTLLFGGLSYGFYSNGVFETDTEIPFVNQVTTIKLDKHGDYSQYLMDAEYPLILSTMSNPGNQLLFGAGAKFMRNLELPAFENRVLHFDDLGSDPVVVGYIVGGIQSTLPNTNTSSDSAASPYIFKVTLTPKLLF